MYQSFSLGWASIVYECVHAARDIDPTQAEDAVVQTTLRGHACPNCATLVLAVIEGK